MVYKIVMFLCLSMMLACGSQSPLSSERTALSDDHLPETTLQPMNWQDQLHHYQLQIDMVLQERKGAEDFASLYGKGSGYVSGNGTFIGEGYGLAELEGIGIVTGELTGTAQIMGTDAINIHGLEYIGNSGGYEEYEGSGYFTVTSDLGQKIEVILDGEGWVIGAGSGVVFWSGDGWTFWYH